MTATPSITADPQYATTQREALNLYESLDGVSNLDRRAEVCYEACRNLYDEFTIAKIAKAEDEYLRSRFKVSTLGTKLSKHGYYKLFRSILLKDGLNAYQEEKHDGSKTLKHLFFKYCGLSASEWVERNDTDRVVSRLGNAQTLNPGEVIEKAIALTQSDDHWEIAAGLIALTGRRPHEIVARAKFTVDGEYRVMFEGQGKKRGEKPVFPIATLASAELVVSTLGHLRNRIEIKSLLKEVRANNPRNLVKQNDEIDRRTNKSINRAVKREFSSVLPARDGETGENCKALRAAYSAIATRRDIPNGSIGEQMLYAARLLGHFVSEEPTDNDLKNITTTIGYSDYRVNGEVPRPTMPKSIPHKENPVVRASLEAKEQINQWKDLWGCTQHEVVDRLVAAMNEKLETPPAPEITTTSEEEEMTSSQTDTRLDALEAKFDALTQMIRGLAQGQPVQPQTESISEPTPEPKPEPTKPKPTRDWSQVSNDELFGLGEFERPARGTGASDERIARAVQAIIDHNDQFPAGENTNKKWSLDKFAVRQMSGCNGQVVARWFDEHHGLVSDHNQKHGLTDVFHNRDSHQGEEVRKLLPTCRPQPQKRGFKDSALSIESFDEVVKSIFGERGVERLEDIASLPELGSGYDILHSAPTIRGASGKKIVRDEGVLWVMNQDNKPLLISAVGSLVSVLPSVRFSRRKQFDRILAEYSVEDLRVGWYFSHSYHKDKEIDSFVHNPPFDKPISLKTFLKRVGGRISEEQKERLVMSFQAENH